MAWRRRKDDDWEENLGLVQSRYSGGKGDVRDNSDESFSAVSGYKAVKETVFITLYSSILYLSVLAKLRHQREYASTSNHDCKYHI